MLIACNFFTKKYGSLANLGIDRAVFLNTAGKRFVAEDSRRDVMAKAVLEQPQKVRSGWRTTTARSASTRR